jgi:hypothetical protein
MTIATTASTSAVEVPRAIYAGWLGFTSVGFMGLVVVGVRRKSRKKSLVLSALLLMLLLAAMGCGGHQQTAGTPRGTSTVTVTGSTANFTHTTTFKLTVN